ncbi:MAG TPA: Zn-dependent hydrolase [Hyphomicrobiaceae bacterium]|nr:Zn-dependent hydrolase [Hyphomicrobiaceae bacterium]
MNETSAAIDAASLGAMLAESSRIGGTNAGGLRRLALSMEDKAARDQLAGWAKQGGWGLSIDAIGNMFIRREGKDGALPPVLVGSHLDTQAKGGRFDGILGVLSGVEILRTLDRLGIATRRPIEVVNWTNEEGARFQPPMMCSLCFSGEQTVDWIYKRQDKDGVRFRDALEAIGYRGKSPVGGRPIDSYFELHIEQGPKLDAAGIELGIVTGGFTMRGMRISVRGETSHAGPTPMGLRRNALVGAAYMAVAVDDIGWRYAPEDGKTSAARLDLAPNLPGILSDEAELYIDFRHPSPDRLADMERDVEAAVAESARRSRTDISIAERWGFGGLEFHPELIGLVRETASRLGVSTMDIRSQAGHDAYNMTKVCPTTMLFTPCRGGISHNEKEDIDLAATVPAINVLLHAVLARAAA